MSAELAVIVGLWSVVVGVVAVLWLRDRQQRTQRELALDEQRVALEERRIALEEQRVAANEDMPAMPLDLVMRCNNETETWAREQMRSVVQQLWSKHRSWDGVRSEMAAMDAAALAAEMGWSQTKQVS